METSLIKLENFLNQHRYFNDNSYQPTHMSYGKLQGKFIIDDTKQNQFIKLYSNAIKDGHKLSILEKPKEYGPLVIDIDIKLLYEQHDESYNARLYNDKLINAIIKLYTDELNNYIESNDNKQYDFFIFEKNKPTIKDNIIKDGFHIMVPKLCLHFDDKFHLREQVIKKANEYQLFNGFYESTDQIIDKAIIKSNGWFLYGSTKPDRLDDPYKINKVLRYSFLDNSFEDITDDIVDIKIKSIIKYLSINNTDFYNETNRTKCKTIIKVLNNVCANTNTNINTNDKFLIIEKLLNMLNDNRAKEYDMWRNIMLILNNELGKDGIDLAHMFSKKSIGNYNEKSVNEFYYRIKKNDSGLKLATLKMYAKEDNPDEYNKLFKNYDKIKDEFNKNEYNKLKIEFEKTHFKLENPSVFVCIYGDKIVFKKKTDLIVTYENKYYPIIKELNEHKEVKDNKAFIYDWLKDTNIKTYQEIDFRPKQIVPSNIYNIFKKYEAENKSYYPIDIKTTKLWTHLFNLCGCEQNVFDYVLNCLANVIQQPYNLTKVCLLFKSKEGSGKDSFFNWFGNKVIGSQYYLNDSNVELMFGRFNNLLENKVLVVINETEHNDTMKTIGKIKDSITKPINKIEYKGVNPFEQQNNVFYVYLTNNSNPIPISASDRRICAIECNNSICNNAKYFDELHKELNSGQIDRAFYDFLNSRDIKNYDFTNGRPVTKYYKELKLRNKPVIVQFLCDVIIDSHQNENIIEFTGAELYDDFKRYLSNNGYSTNYSSTKFGLDIKEYNGINKNRSNGAKYVITCLELKQHLINLNYYENDFIDY